MTHAPDRVVRELEVYVCNDFPISSVELSLLQQPLRPYWRPYALDQEASMRMKPSCKKVEIDVPLETFSANYTDAVEERKKIKMICLKSSRVEAKTSYAVGVLKDGKILLAPVSCCLQLRPKMDYLDQETAKPTGKSEAEESEEEQEVTAVEVQVSKRETERQQKQRLSSYAYLQQKEDEEPWKPLKIFTMETEAAEVVWNKYMSPLDKAMPGQLTREQYLRKVVPGESEGGGLATTVMVGGPTDNEIASPSTGSLSTEALAALPLALKALFVKHGVATLKDIRTWLAQYPDAGAARDAGKVTDRVLHEAITVPGEVICIRRVYILKKTGNAAMDPFRELFIDILRDKEQFRKAEVMEAAQAAKLSVTESLFQKVARELCTSRGSYWTMKMGADL